MPAPSTPWTRSVFNEYETAFHERLGIKERMDQGGRRMVRDYMPDQHRTFFASLPFITCGIRDEEGAVWASVIAGREGFITSPDDKTLTFTPDLHPDDPIHQAIQAGDDIGVVGLEFSSRRRNRASGVLNGTSDGFSLKLKQSFGNCPQYIQTRSFKRVERTVNHAPAEELSSLDAWARQLIESADTFMVASYAPGDGPEYGADASHRGGKPGFVSIEADGSLLIPDFAGNNHFNTFGNFVAYNNAGITFIDFATGDLLMMTGMPDIIWDGPLVDAFRGADRAWRFTPTRIMRLPAALPLRWAFDQFSPNSLMTGSWAEARAQLEAAAKRDSWREMRVVRIEDESTLIRSFYLEPADGGSLAPFKAGQFLTLRVQTTDCGRADVRTYTVSSAPHDGQYRISVKREDKGGVSACLHDHVSPGSLLQVRAPAGDFHLDESHQRPVVLLSGGVGITPMMSMLRHIAFEGVRNRGARPTTFIHAAKTASERAFLEEARSLASATENISVYSVLSTPEAHLEPGKDYSAQGRITPELLRAVLALDDYDFYLCGPSGFMQAVYDMLRRLGVRDNRIFAEAFGPAALTRQADADAPIESTVGEADQSVVHFKQSGFEQNWTPEEGTLLEFAEAHGLAPEFGCRAGSCGSCSTKLLKGAVSYRTKPQIPVEDGHVLTCCAVPARDGGEGLILDL